MPPVQSSGRPRQIRTRKREVEDLGVLGDALPMRRLRDDRDAPLDAPAQQHLADAPVATRDPRDGVAGEVTAGSEWAVGLQRDLVFAARLEESLAVLVRTELHLIHDGRDRRSRQQLPQVVDAEVGDPDRPRIPELTGLLHPGHAQVGPPAGQWMMYRST